jgi:hypothetical protein
MLCFWLRNKALSQAGLSGLQKGANGCNPIQASKNPILVSESTPKQGENLAFFCIHLQNL